jgi:hypothetical protein
MVGGRVNCSKNGSVVSFIGRRRRFGEISGLIIRDNIRSSNRSVPDRANTPAETTTSRSARVVRE